MSPNGFAFRLIRHTLTGALLGYVVLHPVSVIIYDISGPGPVFHWTAIISAFNGAHIKMAIYFTIIGAAFGLINGLNAHRQAVLFARVQRLSITDDLTGLYNRHYFMNHLAGESRRAERYGNELSLVMIDIDHFKQYNDIHGHPAGDRLLRQFAERLKHLTRVTDTVARYGGEEFLVLLPDTDIDMAARLAERIRKDIEDYPFELQETQPDGNLTVSVGCAQFDTDSSNGFQEVIKKADECLYLAKKCGRNQIWY